MKKLVIVQTLLLVVVLIAAGWLWSRVADLENSLDEAEQVDVYSVMNNMQGQLHKLYYSIEAGNEALSDFYLHELEESAENLIEANVVYHEQPVGMLTRTMLEPVIEELEDDLDNGYWDRLREKRTVLTGACNDCHGATGYEEIVITERGEANPFNQDFQSRK
ncbi:MAG: hypothetical protein R6U28_08030 [Cyclonatronaceae bacterium]